MENRKLKWYRNALWLLYVYLIILPVVIGSLWNDVVLGLVMFTYFYGIPLVIFIIMYFVIIFQLFKYRLKEVLLWKGIIILNTFMLSIAIVPMFFLDDRIAKIFAFFN